MTQTAVRVELPKTASLMTRFAHSLLLATARPATDFGLTLLRHGPVRDKRVFAISSFTDAPLAALVPVAGTRVRPVEFAKFRAEWVWHKETADPAQVQDSAIIYFHGGGYAAAGLNSHRRIVSRFARASRMPLLNVDYRQLPKAHITETIDDAVEAYVSLLAQGFPAQRIISAGDSAGGGLAFALALAARDRGLPVPGGIVSISPWADFDSTARYAHPNRHRDSYLPAGIFEVIASWGYAIDGKLDPAWSPVNHDFTGLPPVLIQVGSHECLLPDSEALARRCIEAGVPYRMPVWDRAPHVFHAAADLLPDARAAIREFGAFTQQILNGRVDPYRTRLRRFFSRRSLAA